MILSVGPNDDGLHHLTNMKKLEVLKIASPFITDKGVEHLGQLTNLKWLYVNGTAITDDGVAELRQALPDCRIVR